jgi:hypothetical protein
MLVISATAILHFSTVAFCMDISTPVAPKPPRIIAGNRAKALISSSLRQINFIQAIERHDVPAALAYLDDLSFDPTSEDNLAIRVASENGLLQVVAKLLDDPRVDPSACNNYAIRNAGKLMNKFVMRRPTESLYLQGKRRAASTPLGCSTGFGTKIEIMRLLMSDPRVPIPSHLRKPSLNHSSSFPLQLQLNRTAIETIKLNDLELYQTYLKTMEASHFYYQNLDFVCLIAFKHGYEQLFMLALLKIMSMGSEALAARGKPRLLQIRHWLEMVFFLLSHLDLLNDIRRGISRKFFCCCMRSASKSFISRTKTDV